MSGTLKIGGKTLATHNSNTNIAKLQLGSANDVVLTDSTGNSILTENGSVVTLNNVDTATIGSNALVVDSSGNVGVGTNSPNKRLSVLADSGEYSIAVQASAINLTKGYAITGPDGSVEGVFTSNAATGEIRFGGLPANYFITCYTSGVERMRIDSAGSTSVFATTADVIKVRSNNGANSANSLYTGFHSCSSLTSGGTLCFNVTTNGNVTNSNGSYGSLSDIKLKENIVDANSQWDDLKALQVRKFNFKEETGQATHTQIGVIAQEVELVSPGLVSELPDRDAEGNDLGTVTKSVMNSILYMKAIKALQEAMERIEALENRIQKLETA